VSVGHLARLIEQAGIATVVIAVRAFRSGFEEMQVARALITPYIMGRPLGFPGDIDGQRAILLAAIDLLDNATSGGTIVDYVGL
jgi:hypothetical protein